jgi:hypothetical protein
MRQRHIRAEKEMRKQKHKISSQSSDKEQEWEKNHLVEKRRFARISKDIVEVQELLDNPPRIIIPERKLGVQDMARQDKTRQDKTRLDRQ